MICKACSKEIMRENAYQSKQAGMEGYYHWKCFIALCKQAHKVGAQRIEGMAVSSGLFGDVTPGGIETESLEGD
ncbi:MAG: hypothetical protein V1784_12265 [bacterium]